jgi:uncharacterized protein (DUF1015 family)
MARRINSGESPTSWVEQIAALMAEKRVIIADGHHRHDGATLARNRERSRVGSVLGSSIATS